MPRRMTPHFEPPRFHAAAYGAFLGALGLALGACDPAPPPADRAAPAAIAVEVVHPELREFTRVVRATGSIFGDEEATIAAKVAGRVVAIHKDLGDIAEPAEPLLQIDPTDYSLARIERERALAQTLARLGLESIPDSTLDIDALPSVERARLQSANAHARFERGRSLADRQPPLISEQDFADLQTAAEVAESELRVERLTAQAILAEARALEAQVATAQQRIADTLHLAPVNSDESGASPTRYEVASRFVSIGDFVQMGDPLFRVVDSDPVKLRVTAPEKRLGAVQVGQSARVLVEAFAEPFEGRVSRISPTVDPATRTFLIEVTVPNRDGRLAPGAFAVAEIEIARESGLALPADAVVAFAGVVKVVTVVDGKAQEQRVSTGDTQSGFVEVMGDLSPSDLVVRRPSGAIVTGAPVEVRAPATEPAE